MTRYQAVGIGNAVVDVITQCDDDVLTRLGIDKGVMQLVEQQRGEFLFDQMQNRNQMPGGSVANSIAGLGALGLKTGFIGRVHDDALGRFYANAMTAEGIDFVNPPVPEGELPTSRSMIFVSPDGERSMNTYLGISAELGPEDVDDANFLSHDFAEQSISRVVASRITREALKSPEDSDSGYVTPS